MILFKGIFHFIRKLESSLSHETDRAHQEVKKKWVVYLFDMGETMIGIKTLLLEIVSQFQDIEK